MENVELTEDGKFNCPVCGNTIWDGENPPEDLACPHIKMIFADLVGEFTLVAKGMKKAQKKVMDAYGAEDYDGDIEEILERTAKKSGCTLHAITTSGMACGPVSGTDYYVIQDEELDEDDCPHCGGRYTEVLEDKEHECYDCGKTYKPSRKAKKGIGNLKEATNKGGKR